MALQRAHGLAAEPSVRRMISEGLCCILNTLMARPKEYTWLHKSLSMPVACLDYCIRHPQNMQK